MKTVSTTEPNYLNDGTASTSAVSETPEENRDKFKLESETVNTENPANQNNPMSATTDETVSISTEVENVATGTNDPKVQDHGTKQRAASTKNVASTSEKGPQPDLTV